MGATELLGGLPQTSKANDAAALLQMPAQLFPEFWEECEFAPNAAFASERA